MSLAGDKKPAPFRYTRRGLRLLAGLIVFSVCGGLIFRAIGIPAGAVAGSMVFGVTYTVIFGKAVYPKQVRPWQQMFAGAYIGASIDKSSVISMKTLFIPLLIMAAGIMIFVFLMSFIIRKTTKMDYVTCLFACTPGGVTEMALLSEELGADTPKIAMVQTSRIVLVIMLFPTMIEFVLPFFV